MAQFTVSGTVVNGVGEKLSFTTVFLQGTAFAASTDDNGYFIMRDVPEGEYSLIAKFIGYRAYSNLIKVSELWIYTVNNLSSQSSTTTLFFKNFFQI